eukprot:Rhum_TRINITY_DN11411_c2_g1::Rhum_TRINITY_DN11411_c2_g1_i1::g.44606::m.44606
MLKVRTTRANLTSLEDDACGSSLHDDQGRRDSEGATESSRDSSARLTKALSTNVFGTCSVGAGVVRRADSIGSLFRLKGTSNRPPITTAIERPTCSPGRRGTLAGGAGVLRATASSASPASPEARARRSGFRQQCSLAVRTPGSESASLDSEVSSRQYRAFRLGLAGDGTAAGAYDSPRSSAAGSLSRRGSLPFGQASRGSISAATSTPRASRRESLCDAGGQVEQVLHQAWEVFDDTRRGFLQYEQVDDLLVFLGVTMETCVEIEFYHAVDLEHNGQVFFRVLCQTYLDFRRKGKFVTCAPIIQISCSLAAHRGVTVDIAAAAWRRVEVTISDRTTPQRLQSMLGMLGLAHGAAEVQELAAWFAMHPLAEGQYDTDSEDEEPLEYTVDEAKDGGSVDGDGADKRVWIRYEDYISLFTDCVTSDEVLRYQSWMQEVQAAVRTRKHRTENVYKSKEQIREEEYDARKHWYDTRFQWLLFVYAQFNIAIPIFLLCFDDPFLRFDGVILERRLPWLIVFVLSDIVVYWQFYLRLVLPQELKGAPVYAADEIRTLYFTSMQFAQDLVVMLPLDLLIGIFFPAGFLHPLFRLNKMLLIFQVHGLFRGLLSNFFGPRWWRIANAIYWWIALGHVLACVFHAIALSAGDEEMRVVLTIADFSRLSPMSRYLQCVSYSINTLAGLSRGLFPSQDRMAVFALFVVIVGVFVYATILAVVALGLSVNNNEGKFKAYIGEVKEVLGSRHNFPGDFVRETIAYHKHVFYSTGQFHIEEDLLCDLPPQLRVSVDLVSGDDVIAGLPILGEVRSDPVLVYALQQCLEMRVYPPNYNIVNIGEQGNEMFFIMCGTCHVRNAADEVQTVLGKGEMFGEIAMLTNVGRTASVHTETFCNVLALNRSDFNLVLGSVPGLLARIQEQARMRIRSLRFVKKQRTMRPRHGSGSSVVRNPLLVSTRSDQKPTPLPEKLLADANDIELGVTPDNPPEPPLPPAEPGGGDTAATPSEPRLSVSVEALAQSRSTAGTSAGPQLPGLEDGMRVASPGSERSLRVAGGGVGSERELRVHSERSQSGRSFPSASLAASQRHLLSPSTVPPSTRTRTMESSARSLDPSLGVGDGAADPQALFLHCGDSVVSTGSGDGEEDMLDWIKRHDPRDDVLANSGSVSIRPVRTQRTRGSSMRASARSFVGKTRTPVASDR